MAALAAFAAPAEAVLFMSAPQTVTTGNGPTRVRLADFNNDGIADFAVTNNGSSTVTVHIGKPDGTFAPGVAYQVGAGPTDMDVIDMTNDGKLDLVVLNNTAGTVAVLYGRGDGTFSTASYANVGTNPTRLLTFRANDNFGRIVTVNTGSDSISYLAQTAAGTLGPVTNFPVGKSPNDIITADLDGDGVGEFIVANGGDNTVSAISRTNGVPTSMTTYPVGPNPTRLTRLSLPGSLYVVATNAGGTSFTALSAQPGRTLKPEITFNLPKSPRAIVSADLNGDGKGDLIIRNDDSSVTVALITLAGDPIVTTYSMGSTGTGFGLNVLDFDGDGNLDIVAANGADGKWMMLPGRGDGTFGPLLSFAAGPGAGTRWGAVDIDDDGKWDVVATPNAAANTVSVLRRVAVPPGIGTVTEFYNTSLDNYFITADPNEASAIDSGAAGPGWIRTGTTYNFKSGGNTYVCRFYGSISPGPNSHFYTALPSECDGLKTIAAQTPASVPRWNFESLDFVATLPALGNCPAGTEPVYRAFNNGPARGKDSNHRITRNRAGITDVLARGWIDEGVQMCAPQ